MPSEKDTSEVMSIRMTTATRKALTIIAEAEGSHVSTVAQRFIEAGIRHYQDPTFVQERIEAKVQEFTSKIPQFLEDAGRLKKP